MYVCMCVWDFFIYIYIYICMYTHAHTHTHTYGTFAVRVRAKTDAAAIFRGLRTVAENNIRVFKSHANPRNVSADKRLDTRGSEGAAWGTHEYQKRPNIQGEKTYYYWLTHVFARHPHVPYPRAIHLVGRTHETVTQLPVRVAPPRINNIAVTLEGVSERRLSPMYECKYIYLQTYIHTYIHTYDVLTTLY